MSKLIEFLKKNQPFVAVAVFGIIAAMLIVIGVVAMKEPVVPVCLAIVIEVGIAVMLHHIELWIHAATIIIQVVAGILIGRLGLMILCVILYIVAILTLQFWNKNRSLAK